jgi:uncharacterized protein (TIGR03085 family)
MTAAQRERAALVATMHSVGPDAPTLCGDWNTRDLAAHLVVRERRLDAAPGILIPQLADYTAKVQRGVAQSTDWEHLLERIASGPPLLSPFKLLDPLVNIAELFIHHEDVRRAESGWEPRQLDDDTVSALKRSVAVMSRMTLAKAPARVSLNTPDGNTIATVGRGPDVTVTGRPEELLLFISGRDAALVGFSGADDTVRVVRDARRGL